MNTQQLYELWVKYATEDKDLVKELEEIRGNADAISDRFYRELEFGTAGLRGELGAGTNRMNVYTVRRATQGLADYVNEVSASPRVAIAYDSRIKSELFAREAACVFAANGVKAFLYPELMPTPMLSFAVRYLGCDAGVVVTASHNPSKYNGYKAYGSDGCQLGGDESNRVFEFICAHDIFRDVHTVPFDEALKSGAIEYIGEEVVQAYLDAVQACSVHPVESDLNVVYTPLHGAGNKPVRAILKRIGVKNVTVVPEQELPDGNFPTVSFPNPEFQEAFDCALKLAQDIKPDLLLATDPDSDRVGIAVRQNGEYLLVTGNEVGCLMLDYILKVRKEQGTLPKNPVAVKTIVTSDMTRRIGEKYGCEVREVLTGFKYIGEQIRLLEDKGEENRFVLGFEESYGYLAGSYVRDKDAVIGSMMICEMASYYKERGKTLIDALNDLYAEHGVYLHSQISIYCEGQSGMEQMAGIMASLQKEPPKEIAGYEVEAVRDYITRLRTAKDGSTTPLTLPKTNALFYELADGLNVVVRPSGTEPKIKIYLTARAATREQAQEIAEKLGTEMKRKMGF